MRRLGPLFLLVAGFGTPLPAQTSVQAPGGNLSGVVRDSATGQPVSYALVILQEPNLRVFAGENGRFGFAGVGPGRITLRVQQIGYRAVTLPLQVESAAGGGGGSPLSIVIARLAYVLPEIQVEGDVCAGRSLGELEAGEGGILAEVFQNAERLLTIERAYPFRGAFQRETTVMDAAYRRSGGWVDTVRFDSQDRAEYRKGRVLERRGINGPEHATYFTSSDLATAEFRRFHCFWFAGKDSVEGVPGYKIGFAPAKNVKSADWAGSMILDSASMTLIRSDARMVNLPLNSSFRSALCTVLYQQIVPTLVLEFQARCVAGHATVPPRIVVERWLLVRHDFIGKRPGGDSLP